MLREVNSGFLSIGDTIIEKEFIFTRKYTVNSVLNKRAFCSDVDTGMRVIFPSEITEKFRRENVETNIPVFYRIFRLEEREL